MNPLFLAGRSNLLDREHTKRRGRRFASCLFGLVLAVLIPAQAAPAGSNGNLTYELLGSSLTAFPDRIRDLVLEGTNLWVVAGDRLVEVGVELAADAPERSRLRYGSVRQMPFVPDRIRFATGSLAIADRQNVALNVQTGAESGWTTWSVPGQVVDVDLDRTHVAVLLRDGRVLVGLHQGQGRLAGAWKEVVGGGGRAITDGKIRIVRAGLAAALRLESNFSSQPLRRFSLIDLAASVILSDSEARPWSSSVPSRPSSELNFGFVAVNGFVYAADGEVWDVFDPSRPVLLGRQNYFGEQAFAVPISGSRVVSSSGGSEACVTGWPNPREQTPATCVEGALRGGLKASGNLFVTWGDFECRVYLVTTQGAVLVGTLGGASDVTSLEEVGGVGERLWAVRGSSGEPQATLGLMEFTGAGGNWRIAGQQLLASVAPPNGSLLAFDVLAGRLVMVWRIRTPGSFGAPVAVTFHRLPIPGTPVDLAEVRVDWPESGLGSPEPLLAQFDRAAGELNLFTQDGVALLGRRIRAADASTQAQSVPEGAKAWLNAWRDAGWRIVGKGVTDGPFEFDSLPIRYLDQRALVSELGAASNRLIQLPGSQVAPLGEGLFAVGSGREVLLGRVRTDGDQRVDVLSAPGLATYNPFLGKQEVQSVLSDPQGLVFVEVQRVGRTLGAIRLGDRCSLSRTDPASREMAFDSSAGASGVLFREPRWQSPFALLPRAYGVDVVALREEADASGGSPRLRLEVVSTLETQATFLRGASDVPLIGSGYSAALEPLAYGFSLEWQADGSHRTNLVEIDLRNPVSPQVREIWHHVETEPIVGPPVILDRGHVLLVTVGGLWGLAWGGGGAPRAWSYAEARVQGALHAQELLVWWTENTLKATTSLAPGDLPPGGPTPVERRFSEGIRQVFTCGPEAVAILRSGSAVRIYRTLEGGIRMSARVANGVAAASHAFWDGDRAVLVASDGSQFALAAADQALLKWSTCGFGLGAMELRWGVVGAPAARFSVEESLDLRGWRRVGQGQLDDSGRAVWGRAFGGNNTGFWRLVSQ